MSDEKPRSVFITDGARPNSSIATAINGAQPIAASPSSVTGVQGGVQPATPANNPATSGPKPPK